jgi:hypothetical protein
LELDPPSDRRQGEERLVEDGPDGFVAVFIGALYLGQHVKRGVEDIPAPVKLLFGTLQPNRGWPS